MFKSFLPVHCLQWSSGTHVFFVVFICWGGSGKGSTFPTTLTISDNIHNFPTGFNNKGGGHAPPPGSPATASLIVCEGFLVKLTFVEVHDKKESKLFSLASCTN
jgi:hypothetical protein